MLVVVQLSYNVTSELLTDNLRTASLAFWTNWKRYILQWPPPVIDTSFSWARIYKQKALGNPRDSKRIKAYTCRIIEDSPSDTQLPIQTLSHTLPMDHVSTFPTRTRSMMEKKTVVSRANVSSWSMTRVRPLTILRPTLFY